MLQNLKTLFSKRWVLPVYGILVFFQASLWYYFTDVEIMFGNYGALHTWTDILLSWATFLLFPLFIFAFVYKSHAFGTKNTKTTEKTGFLGGVIATIISGSSCCGLTLASYFGLLPLMQFLPGSGIEIKILATLALCYATFITLRDMQSCAIQKK
ncbi:hypothetical protein CSB09_01940 [Candidatus Gracilibacteria bacterium]|nr:MAG: hypothetical protein CSB09_01940 [Candidatus Gracilibacteria bacterium]